MVVNLSLIKKMSKQNLLDSLKSHGISKQTLKTFEKVKRENFVPKEVRHVAYEDTALPVGEEQTISQPYTIAVMLDLLQLKPGHKVLEIGSGSGYALALISEIVAKKGFVYGVEIIKSLAEKSKKTLKSYKNVKVYNKSGSEGLKEQAPFDRILISAALKEIPKTISERLKDNGILVAPVDDGSGSQDLVAFQRKNNKFVVKTKKPGFVFVKFV